MCISCWQAPLAEPHEAHSINSAGAPARFWGTFFRLWINECWQKSVGLEPSLRAHVHLELRPEALEGIKIPSFAAIEVIVTQCTALVARVML